MTPVHATTGPAGGLTAPTGLPRTRRGPWRRFDRVPAAKAPRAALRPARGGHLLGFLDTGRPAPGEGRPRPRYGTAGHLSRPAPAARPLPAGGTDR